METPRRWTLWFFALPPHPSPTSAPSFAYFRSFPLFRHSQGGTGCASTQRPLRAVLAACSPVGTRRSRQAAIIRERRTMPPDSRTDRPRKATRHTPPPKADSSPLFPHGRPGT